MAQTMLVVSLCLILIVSVLAEEKFRTNGGDNIEENGSNKPPENIDETIIEGKSVSPHTRVHAPPHAQSAINKKTAETVGIEQNVNFVSECKRFEVQDSDKLTSPINIDRNNLIDKKANLPNIFIDNFEVQSVNIRIEEETKRLEFVYGKAEQNSPAETTNHGGTKAEYDLTTIQVHVPARHTLNGKHYDAEIEFIYTENVAEMPKEVALSILVTIGKPNKNTNTFMDGIEAISDLRRTKLDLHEILSKATVLPGDWYKGTYMTEPCSKEITRYIAKDALTISSDRAEVWTKYINIGNIAHPPTPEKEQVFKDF